MKQKKSTKKAFREYLNNMFYGNKYKNGKYGQRKRDYGDYLYKQDPIMFNVNYQQWLTDEVTL